MEKAKGCDTLSRPEGGTVGPSEHRTPVLIRQHTVHYHRVRGHEVSGNHTCFTLSSTMILLSGPGVYFWGIKPLAQGRLNRNVDIQIDQIVFQIFPTPGMSAGLLGV